MDCSPDYLGMDPKFINTIFNQYFCHGPEIPGKPAVTDQLQVQSSIKQDSSATSDTKRIDLNFVSSHGEKMKASMIIKTRKTWENSIQASNYDALFRTEVKMYTTLLPLMTDVMTQAGDEREALWPVMYGYQSANLLALQDLTGMGFEVKRLRTGLSEDDSLLVVKNIARFHAMSRPLVDRGLVSLPSAESSEIYVNQIYKTLFAVLCHSMETSWAKEWLPMADWIRTHHDDVLRTVGQLQLENDKGFDVVNHGDLWTSNLMFRTGSKNSLPSVRFIDFQLSNVNSFIWDLEFFFWTSVNPRVRTTMKSFLLKEYQESLQENLKILGYSGYIPTLDDVLAESKRIEIAGLVFLLFGAVVRSDVPQAIAMDKLMTHQPLEVVNQRIFSGREAQKMLGEDLKFLGQQGIIPST
uniref:CHK kinase-like domain-containing protein n=1 Tax=Lygus hesperus TaxID=30085 RepID=A0A146KYK2_LYGHE